MWEVMMTHDCSYLGQWRGTIAGRVTWSKPSSWVHQFFLLLLSSTPSFLHWSRSCFEITWPNKPLRAEFLSHSLNSHAQGHSECVTMLRQWRIFCIKESLSHHHSFNLTVECLFHPQNQISNISFGFHRAFWSHIETEFHSQEEKNIFFLTDKRN